MRRKFKYTFTRKEETEGGFFFTGFCRLLAVAVSGICVSLFSGKGKQKAGSERLV